MPIYEYFCPVCQREFEILQKSSTPNKKTCPHCGKNKLKKQVSTTSFQLKGKGWYVTDFRDKNKKATTPSTPETPETKTKTKDTDKQKQETP